MLVAAFHAAEEVYPYAGFLRGLLHGQPCSYAGITHCLSEERRDIRRSCGLLSHIRH